MYKGHTSDVAYEKLLYPTKVLYPEFHKPRVTSMKQCTTSLSQDSQNLGLLPKINWYLDISK